MRESGLITVDPAKFDGLPCCGIKCPTNPGRRQKLCWMQANARFGLQGRLLVAAGGQVTGYIEYIPGEYAWRAVDAAGYMFIHCIWNHSRQHQGKGWGGTMIDACIDDARRAGMRGVAIVVREGPWMAGRGLFVANGFETVDTAPPDYELLVRKFRKTGASPGFPKDWERRVARYGAGLTIVQSGQCPYVAKFTAEIAQSAEREYQMRPKIVELESWQDAQNAPTPYATFSLIHNGRLLADHQISRTRFRNIMNRLVPTL
jgi:L-amino acid N-acyltransferase YncA